MTRGACQASGREGKGEREARGSGQSSKRGEPREPGRWGGKGGRGEKVYPPPPELAARERAGMGAPRHPSTPIGGSGMWFPTVRTPRVPLLPDCSSRLRCTQPGDPSTIDGEATRGECDESHGGIGKTPTSVVEATQAGPGCANLGAPHW